MTLIYPRLPLPFARTRIDAIAAALNHGGLGDVAALASTDHPRAAPVATGGRVADGDHIADVRSKVLHAVEPWRERGTVTRAEAANFDLTLGRALHAALQIVPADAAHDATWSFLSLVVLPDVVVLRFPDMHADRMLGTQRNALRRTWSREEVLGDIQHAAANPLGEDELVGLFERTALARNRGLVRRLAIAVTEYDGASARSEWARDLYKRVTFTTGPRLLDALTDQELDALIAGSEVAGAIASSPDRSNRSTDATDAARTDLIWPTTSAEGLTGSGDPAGSNDAEPVDEDTEFMPLTGPHQVTDSGWLAIHHVYKGHRVEGAFNPSTLEVRLVTSPWTDSHFSSPTAAAQTVVEYFSGDIRESPNTNGRKFWKITATGEDLRSVVGQR